MFSKEFSGSMVTREERDVPASAGHQMFLFPAQHHGPAVPSSAQGWRSRLQPLLCHGLLVSSGPGEAVSPPSASFTPCKGKEAESTDA